MSSHPEPQSVPFQTGNATLDGEHRVQVDLINALCDAVEFGPEPADVGRILAQLTEFSRAHFASEELLMRMDSYDGFDEHVEDHAHMLEVLQQMQDKHDRGQPALIPGQARQMLSFLERHIETKDARYASWPRV
jgi:hemerythrin-like metal-binding protein